jgi:N-methylhydantoinase B
VHSGLVSRKAAERDYGVILHDDDTVDAAATETRRKQAA